MKLEQFNGCKDFNEVKKRYRELVKKYHPDLHPNIDLKLIQDLVAQYQYIEKYDTIYPINIPTTHSSHYSDFNFSFKQSKRTNNPKREKAKEESKKEYNKPKEETKIKDEISDKIKIAYGTIIERDLDKGSLYYSFINYAKKKDLILEKKHFDLIGKLCGYSVGWSYYKWEEYTKSKI